MAKANDGSVGEIAALRWFPSERQTIEELIVCDDIFRDLCEELADAELALKAAAQLPLNVREGRVAEWLATVDRQVAEIGQALRDANVPRPRI